MRRQAVHDRETKFPYHRPRMSDRVGLLAPLQRDISLRADGQEAEDVMPSKTFKVRL